MLSKFPGRKAEVLVSDASKEYTYEINKMRRLRSFGAYGVSLCGFRV